MARPSHGRPYVCGPYKHRARFRLQIYTGQRRGDGRRERPFRNRSFETREAARRWRAEFERQVACAGRSVGDAMIDFLAWKERKGNKARSLVTDRYRLEAILDVAMPLASLRAPQAQALYDELVDRPNARGGKTAADTHQACLVQAKAFGRFCVDRSLLSVNPFEKVEPVGRKSRGKLQLRLDEARTFYEHCMKAWREDKDATAIGAVLPFVMNLRATEVAELEGRDVDDKGRILWVAEGEDERGEDKGKTDAARRRLKIPAPLRPIMMTLAALAGADGRLFTLLDGRPADRHRVADWARIHMRRAKVRVVSTHGLRGTHSTLATEAGTSPEQLARSMGHESPAMTERHYIQGEARQGADLDRLMETLEDKETEQ